MKPINFDLNRADLRPLPCHREAEQMVLGILLLHPEKYSTAARYLKMKATFYGLWEAELWERITTLHTQNQCADMVSVISLYRVEGRGKEVEEIMHLAQVGLGQEHRLVRLCLLLCEHAYRRVLHRMGYWLNTEAVKPQRDVLDVLGEATDVLQSIHSQIAGMTERTSAEAVQQVVQQLVRITCGEKESAGLPSSLPGLGERIKGYRKGVLLVVAASTGEGKSTLAYQEALHQARAGHPVGIMSLEMQQDEIILMMACGDTGVSLGDYLGNGLGPAEVEKLRRFFEEFKRLPIYIDDTAGLRISEARAKARMWKQRHGLQALYIDHLHLMRHDIATLSQEERYTDIANQCKELAKELSIPIILLAQLSRRDKTDRVRAHILEDLKYASGIEQAADVVLLLYRPEHHGIYDLEGESTRQKAVIIVAKLRLMERKNVVCGFWGGRFWEGGSVLT